MKYVVYLDVMWLQNTILDVILLSLLTRYRKGRIKKWNRIIIGSALGGFFSTASYGIPLLNKYQIPYELLSCMGVIYLSIPHEGDVRRQIRSICRESCILYGMLFLLAGIWNWVVHRVPSFKNVFWLSVLIIWAFGMLLVTWIERMKRFDLGQCFVRLFLGNRMIELSAIIDTGNSLREPATNKPVSIVEKSAVKAFLEEKIKVTDLCVIPYHSIGKKGVLYGIKLPKMEIVKGEEMSVEEDVIVAVYPGKLNLARNCKLIVHPDLCRVRD